MVLRFRKCTASMVAPTDRPRKMVTMSMSDVPAVFFRRSVTPDSRSRSDSRSRLPNISMPMRGAQEGTAREAPRPVMMGKRITAVRETCLAWGMSMARSLRVVSIRMMGGWMMGTRDM
jgi:hypothetical protein